MMTDYQNVISFLIDSKKHHPSLMKEELENLVEKKFFLRRERSVLVGTNYALRFSEVNGTANSFSNVVLSLSALKRYDDKPFIVVIVRIRLLEFRLANTTFLKKVSHSSQALTMANIKGSFLGHDIHTEYNSRVNKPEFFELLFKEHSQITWETNLRRLVFETSNIQATGSKFLVNNLNRSVIESNPSKALILLEDSDFRLEKLRLIQHVHSLESSILKAAVNRNINTRGNSIEQLITKGVNKHNSSDLEIRMSDGRVLKVDIKTKIAGLSSNPKGYNVDKLLEDLSNPCVFIFYLFVVIDATNKTVLSNLINIFDSNLINQTRIQHHWAGRNSRGVTQLSGDVSCMVAGSYKTQIDLTQAEKFIKTLIG